MQALREAGRADIDSFVQSWFHIQNDQGNDMLLKYNWSQRQVAWTIQLLEQQYGYVRLFELKSRQVGVTTAIQLRNNAIAICNDNMAVATVAHLDKRASEILDKAKYAHAKLPQMLQLTLSRDSKDELKYADTFSCQTIVSAKNIEAVRSSTRQHVHLSEWCLYGDAEHALYEVSQVCHMVPRTSIIIESTGRREGSYAHWFWNRCVQGKEVFFPQFLAWQKDPNTNLQFANDKQRDACLQEAYIYAPELAERARLFNLTPGNVYWAYLMLKNQCYGNWEKFLEDYPCSPEECWRSKGGVFFGAHNVTYLTEHVKQFHYDAFYVSQLKLEQKFGNPYTDLDPAGPEFNPLTYDQKPFLIIYKGPQPGRQYIVTGDSAQGGPGGDPSSTYVGDKHSGEMMAEFQGLVQTHQHAHVIESLGIWYNNGLAAPECNDIGLATLAELNRTYPYIYRWKKMDTVEFREGNYGWYTGTKSRPIMLDLALRVVKELVAGHASCADFIKSARLVQEMKSFKENENTGKPEAASGCHDDAVMAFAIFWIVAQMETKGSHDDILLRLRAPELPHHEQSRLILPPKIDVAENIARIKAHLGLEDIYNVVPLSEK